MMEKTRILDSLNEQALLLPSLVNPGTHRERSLLMYRTGYATAGVRTTCFACLPIKSQFFMQYAG